MLGNEETWSVLRTEKKMKVIFHESFYEVYTMDPAAESGRMEAVTDVVRSRV